MTKEEAAEVLIAALRLAGERVTGDTITVKAERRSAVQQAIGRVRLEAEFGESGLTAGEIRELLGDPGDREVRQALEAWESHAS